LSSSLLQNSPLQHSQYRNFIRKFIAQKLAITSIQSTACQMLAFACAVLRICR